MIPFVDWLSFHAAMRPARVAFATPRIRLTYAQLHQAALSIAARLHAAGVRRGQKAAIFVLNPAMQCTLLVALNRLGVTGSIFPQEVPRRVAAMNAVAYDWLLTDVGQETGGTARKIDVDLSWLTEPADSSGLPPAVPLHPDWLCLIAISSGTTSKPKPIAFTAAQLERRIAWRGFEEQATYPGERTYVLLGMASMLSFLTVFGTLYAGGTIYSGWPTEQAPAVIAEERIQRLVGTPPLLSIVLPSLEKLSEKYPALRLVYTGGDVLPEPLSRRITEKLCRNLVTAFGTNETGQVAVGRVARMGFHPQLVGFPLPWACIEVVDDDDRPLPPDTEGRLRFRTPGMASGYLDNPEATAAHFKHGWFYPGDIGRITGDGALFMAGRISDLITTESGRFNPRPLDLALCEFSSIAEAAAFGVRGADGKDAIWLAYVARAELDMTALREFCAAQFGPKAPQHFLELQQLPRNESGKVLRWALVEMAVGNR